MYVCMYVCMYVSNNHIKKQPLSICLSIYLSIYLSRRGLTVLFSGLQDEVVHTASLLVHTAQWPTPVLEHGTHGSAATISLAGFNGEQSQKKPHTQKKQPVCTVTETERGQGGVGGDTQYWYVSLFLSPSCSSFLSRGNRTGIESKKNYKKKKKK